MRTQSSINLEPDLTAWSIIASPASDEEDRQAHLLRLSLGYFYPVYAHVRACGHAPQQAYGYSQGYVEQLVAALGTDQPEERFRSYLYKRLVAFCRHPVEPAGPVEGSPDAADIERRYQIEGENAAKLEVAFETRYARELMVRTITRLKDEAEHNGKRLLFETLISHLAADPSTDQAQELSKTLQMSPLALAIALKRLRARYAEISNEELANTLLDPNELEVERAAFHTILQ